MKEKKKIFHVKEGTVSLKKTSHTQNRQMNDSPTRVKNATHCQSASTNFIFIRTVGKLTHAVHSSTVDLSFFFSMSLNRSLLAITAALDSDFVEPSIHSVLPRKTFSFRFFANTIR